MTAPTILWLRQDLRLADQPALRAACEAGAVVPLYVLDDETPGDWRIGGTQRWWLHHSLAALDDALRAKGARLILRRGPAAETVAALADEIGAGTIHAVRHVEPWWVEAEAALGDRLTLHEGNYLIAPERVRSGAGTPFKVYSAFWRALSALMPPPAPVAAPRAIPAPAKWPKSDRLTDWNLLPTGPDWSGGFGEEWTPGEAGAAERLKDFDPSDYADGRNLPSEEGSSRLSPHLHFGEVSPAQVWHATKGRGAGATTFHKELAWRDFAAATVLANPDYARRNGRAAFDDMPWRRSRADLRAWQRGLTGYPIVDAGMRQLWTTGWMHNRVRMITASFLIKHLLIDWRIGERWFWDTLLCADYGNNSVNWQWVAGTGIDSNMFGRIMAPLVQSRKFDAAGYIRQWVPELADLPDEAIHDPDEAGCRPDTYPAKIVGHREARERALAAGRAVRG